MSIVWQDDGEIGQLKSPRGKMKESLARFSAWRQCLGIEDRNPVLVYQMGKVGSTSVARTLRAMDGVGPVLQVHTLNPERIEGAISRCLASSRAFIPEHLFVSRQLSARLAQGSFPCRLITLTREPVARAISFVFEDWRKQAPSAPRGGDLDVEQMRTAVDKLLAGDNGIANPGMWFEAELRSVFGIDVFSKGYDFEAGYAIYRHGDISLLTMRVEDLDRALPAGLHALLGIKPTDVPILDANRGDRKWYADVLAEVQRSYSLPTGLRRRIFATRYARHFYSGLRQP